MDRKMVIEYTYSVHLDKMAPNVAAHQCLYCLLWQTETQFYFEIQICAPQNRQVTYNQTLLLQTRKEYSNSQEGVLFDIF